MTEGGALRVRSGSRMTVSGIMLGWRRLTFRLASSMVMTALRVASAPVPEVVGMAIMGAGGWVRGWASPISSR